LVVRIDRFPMFTKLIFRRAKSSFIQILTFDSRSLVFVRVFQAGFSFLVLIQFIQFWCYVRSVSFTFEVYMYSGGIDISVCINVSVYDVRYAI